MTQYIVKLQHVLTDDELGSSVSVERVSAPTKELAIAKAYQRIYRASYSRPEPTRFLYVVTSVRKAPTR